VCTEDEMLEETFQLLWPEGTATDLEAVKVLYIVCCFCAAVVVVVVVLLQERHKHIATIHSS